MMVWRLRYERPADARRARIGLDVGLEQARLEAEQADLAHRAEADNTLHLLVMEHLILPEPAKYTPVGTHVVVEAKRRDQVVEVRGLATAPVVGRLFH